MQSHVHHGIIHGKSIQLDEDTGLPDGQAVTIIVQIPEVSGRLPPGEGIRRSAGGWADDPAGLDEYLAWNRSQRKTTRREIEL
ncbi:MAG TPA: hypothetical protein VHY91_25425 [Pirellulales bacterium]|jgi:hypothetical protein|nr:hypothetical protein [Pirellulales bacterium]HEX4146863.1 hypothetical protein [Pirellulales bacterium]